MNYLNGLKFEDLGTPSEDTWTLSSEDSETGLKLVHYTETADLEKWGHLRGTIFTADGLSVVHSGQHADIIVSDFISIEGDELVCHDHQTGSVKRIKSSKIWRGEEGVVIRAFKYHGKVYISTYHSLDAGKSFWGSDKSFLDHFKGVIPHPEELFDPNYDDSDFVHIFLLRGPNTSSCTKEPIVFSKVYLCETIRLRNTGQIISPIVKRVPKCVEFTANEANVHLKYGHLVEQLTDEAGNLPQLENKELYPFCNHEDYRRGFGEFIAVKEGHKTWKIQSRAYSWRSMIYANSQRLETRLFRMIDDSLVKYMSNEEFVKKYVLFRSYTDEEMADLEDHIVAFDVHEGDIDLSKSKIRLKIIMLNLIFASTVCKQKEAYEAYVSILLKRKRLIKLFIQMLKKGWQQPESDSKEILGTARILNLSIELTNRNANPSDLQSYLTLLKQNVSNIVCNERGESLRKLCEFYGISVSSSSQDTPVTSHSSSGGGLLIKPISQDLGRVLQNIQVGARVVS